MINFPLRGTLSALYLFSIVKLAAEIKLLSPVSFIIESLRRSFMSNVHVL